MGSKNGWARVLVLLVALGCLSAGAMQVAAVGGDTGAEIEQSVFREEIDDVVDVPLAVPAGSAATLSITSDGYERTIEVTDRNDDGRIVVQIDTYAERTDSGTGYAAAGADTITNRGSTTGAMTTGNHMVELSIDGRYQDTSLLRIVDAQFHEARTMAAQQTERVASTQELRGLPSIDGTVATGDVAIVSFHAEGLTGPADFDSPPGDNLVYADSSAPNAPSTHTVRVESGNRSAQFDAVTVDYASDGGPSPGQLTNARVAHLGIDTDGDGTLDADLTSDVRQTLVAKSGVLTISLTREHTLEESETLLVEYDGIANPKATGNQPVAVSLGGATWSGSIAYGPAGQGVFGNGVDLEIESDSDDVVDPLPVDFTMDADRDRLYVFYEATDRSAMNVTLTKQGAGDTVQSLASSFTVVARDVTIQSYERTGDELTISGTTTMAPGSSLRVWVVTDTGLTQALYDIRTVVDGRQQFRATMNAPAVDAGAQIRVMPKTPGISEETTQFSIDCEQGQTCDV